MKKLNYNLVVSSLWGARVNWLLTYKPKWTWEMFQTNRLELFQSLSTAVDNALTYAQKLKESGRLERDQRDELVLNVIAPTQASDYPDPLPENQELQIRAWAENPPEQTKIM